MLGKLLPATLALGAPPANVPFDYQIGAPYDPPAAEQCGRYGECLRYRQVHGDRVLAIEYRRRDFARACRAVGKRIAVVLRDRGVTAPGYRYRAC